MARWIPDTTTTLGGVFQLEITRLGKGGRTVDVTGVRGAPTQITSYSDADPFGDSVAAFSFPAITPFDDLHAPDLVQWLGYYSNVDLFWVPAMPQTAGYESYPLVTSALTNQPDVIAPGALNDPGGAWTAFRRVKVWEGFLTSFDFSAEEDGAHLQVACQGAMFQLDRYLQKPFYPTQPWPLELLIADAFSRSAKPHLRLQTLITRFPTGWKLKVPKYVGSTTYTPVGKPGSLWSGYTSRQTGSWDHALTGFVQDQLSVMLTDKRSGVTTGNQWTISHRRAQLGVTPGRQPVLEVRDRFRTPDFSVWLGSPGTSVSMSGDSTQSENIIFGDGTGVDGTVWRNAVVSSDGKRTDYLPLAAAREIYPPKSNAAFTATAFASEARTSFGTGFDMPDAMTSAAQALARDREPGWTGSITLRTDPVEMTRWQIQAGMTVRLRGFLGTGEAGFPLHISATSKSPMEGTVELTVDSRFRDLLTVEEAQARTRDPLTPVKMLQVNKTSVMIEDIQAPWDYHAGSGFIPRASKNFFDYKPTDNVFPYEDWKIKHNPLAYGKWYVPCHASARAAKDRWAGPIPILTAEKGGISHTEFSVCDVYGRTLKIPFHVSIYYVNVHAGDMPRDKNNNGPSPYLDNAFESINPATGEPWPAEQYLRPQQSMIIGWGNRSNGVYNRAGFSPGRESKGDHPTGLLTDDAPWTWDCTSYAAYFKASNPPGSKALDSFITLYAMFYAEYKSTVYFQGRLFRQNPGTS